MAFEFIPVWIYSGLMYIIKTYDSSRDRRVRTSRYELVRALVAEKRPVRALVHVNHQTVEGLGVEIVQGNITDVESLCRAFEGAEVVYHLAAMISLLKSEWPMVEKVNVIRYPQCSGGLPALRRKTPGALQLHPCAESGAAYHSG